MRTEKIVERARSAVSGRFIKRIEAERSPGNTVIEQYRIKICTRYGRRAGRLVKVHRS